MLHRCTAGFLIVLGTALAIPAEDRPELQPFPHPKGYVCYRAPAPVAIDGKGNEKAWDAAGWTDAFVDIEGGDKLAPRHRTRVKMLWDDDALYILAELEEPHVWATLREHDSVIFHDNDFEVFLDPDGDNHLYAELEVNAFNTTWDLLLPKPYKDGGKAVNAWEIAGLKTAVNVDGTLNQPGDRDRGWSVEIRWPWSGLKELTRAAAPPRDGDQWRINFSRVEWESEVVEGRYRKVKGREDNWVWSPQGVIDMHRPERWGYLQFSEQPPGKAKFRPDPDWQVRDLLHRVYYAEREYRRTKGKYAGAIRELGLNNVAAPLAGPVTIEATTNGFEAGITYPATLTGKARRLVITHEGRISVGNASRSP